jgi:hypothetical protein
MTYLEEEPDNKDLQRPHAYNQRTLNQAEVDNSLFGRADGAKVAVLSRSEVFLAA